MKNWIWFLFYLLCFISLSSSSPLSVSDADADADADGVIFTSIGRSLLQAKKPCPVNFEIMNYTIITSRCKGPQYPREPCCDAFKDFACPYKDELNDLSNDCSERMFSYINLYRNYTVGLFALCQGDKEGLICPALAPGTEGNNTETDSSNSADIYSSSILRLTTRFIVFLLMWI